MEMESRELIRSLKETVGSIPQKIVDVITGKKVINEDGQPVWVWRLPLFCSFMLAYMWQNLAIMFFRLLRPTDVLLP